MIRRFDYQFQQEVVTIHPGEYFATGEDLAIATILGSCISVALWDEKLKIGGLNHFMLAQTTKESSEITGNIARFGGYAMELLINDLMKMGSSRRTLLAKVFGGASILNNEGGGHNKIPLDNINFALTFLKTEAIPVIAQDIGDIWPRKIYFFPKTSKVLLKKITKQVEKVVNDESSYMKKTEKDSSGSQGGDVIWFN